MKKWMGKNKACASQKYLCIDIETTSLEETGDILEIYYKIMDKEIKVFEDHMVFYSENWELTNHINKIPKDEILKSKHFESDDQNVVLFKNRLKQLLISCCDKDSDIALMAQYSAFEIKWFKEKFKIDLENLKVYDTHYVEKMLFPSISHSLISICKRRKIGSPNGVDFHRAKWDVDAMWLCYLDQKRDIDKSSIYLKVKEILFFLRAKIV